jgi:signal transduction histidine kinase
MIGAESRRLRRLVADLMDLGRMRQGAFAVRRERVELRRVADEVARRYASRAQQYGVALEQAPWTRAGETADQAVDSGTPACVVYGDEDRLVQALSNLVENALRCTPSGGRVTISFGPGRLEVRDTGPGLADADLGRAFERFYLYDRAKAGRPVGTGLGLAIVRQLVEAMGGSVAARSDDKGSEFVIELPPADDGGVPTPV